MLFQVKRLVYLNVIWVEVWKEAVMTHFKVNGLHLSLPKFVNDTSKCSIEGNSKLMN